MVIVTAGVLKENCTVSTSTPPVADWVPAGMVTKYSVAIGMRSINSESYWKLSVLVPSQRQVPGRSGSICTGTSPSARSLIVASATMGWLKVMFTKGAMGISPSGE